MNTYAQNKEDIAIAAYFGDFKGTLLDIGANDGKTLSNSLALIEAGWNGVLVEPSHKACQRLGYLHAMRLNVQTVRVAIGTTDGAGTLQVSGPHLHETDTSLLSTICDTEYAKWKDSTWWQKEEVGICTWSSFLERDLIFKTFDFISIDAEGMDVAILQQMDLTALGCKCLVVEHNSDPATELSIKSHAAHYGLKKILLRNAENICLTL